MTTVGKILVAVIIMGSNITISWSQMDPTFALNEIVIKFKGNHKAKFLVEAPLFSFGHTSLDSLNSKYLLQTVTPFKNHQNNTFVLTFQQNHSIPELVKVYSKIPQLEFVEPNYLGYCAGQSGCLSNIPNDSLFHRQYGLLNDGRFQFGEAKQGADIDMDLAWEIEQGDSSIVVALLDSGVKLNHPEITSRIWINPLEESNETDDDQNGYLNDFRGWDFVNQDDNPTDDNGHGTNIAGIIGAKPNNEMGYVGIDWNCKLMICKVVRADNSGYYSWWANAIYYAVDNGAHVINMSLGGLNYSRFLENAVNYAHERGVTVVSSMMNLNTNKTYYPAGFKNSIAVGSTDPNDERTQPFFWDLTSGSNYGKHIDVVAAGNYIFGLDGKVDNNYNVYWGGTSQATPLVTGLCALLLAQDPNRHPDDLKSIIQATAEDEVGHKMEDTPGFDVYYGYGRINAFDALNYQVVSNNKVELRSPKTTIAPNPVKDEINIHSNIPLLEISIFDLVGKMIQQNTFPYPTQEQRIKLQGINSGPLFLQFKSRNLTWTQKVIRE